MFSFQSFTKYRNFLTNIVLTDYGWFQVHKDCSWDVLAVARLAKEGGEGVVIASGGLGAGHVAVRLDAVLQAVQLPARVSHLDPGLANVNGDALALRDTQQPSHQTHLCIEPKLSCHFHRTQLV